jgi:alpha-beta hydrolase superfamily lysophospholipase
VDSPGGAFAIDYWPNPGAGCILFYPGTMLCPRQYAVIIKALRDAGLAVAAIHFTGHGAMPHRRRFTFEGLLANCLAAEAWLRKKGHEAIAACGHSQGGILTLAHGAASKNLTAIFPMSGVLPQRPELLALTRLDFLAEKRANVETWCRGLAKWLPRFPLPVWGYLSLKRLFQGMRKDCIVPRGGGRWWYGAGYLTTLLTATIAPRMHCPVHLFNAADDGLFTPEVIQGTFQALEAPFKRLVWLPGGGHLAIFSPGIATVVARTVAAACADLGMPLRIEASR